MTDRECIKKAAAGDQDAFASLVERYRDRVYRLALRICVNPEDASDAAQEAFLSAWRGLPGFRGDAEFSTWLYHLTSNAAIDQLRRSRKQRGNVSLNDEELGLDVPSRAPSPQDLVEDRELTGLVRQAMETLSDDHRQILALRELRELSYEEIAAMLALDLGTVKSRISRARGALRKKLLENGNLSGYLSSKKVKSDGKGGL